MSFRTKTVKVAVIQTCAGSDVEKNARIALDLTAKAFDRGARLAVLPERFLANVEGRSFASSAGRALVELEAFGPLARRYGAWVMAGSTPAPAGQGKFFNRSVVFSPNGKKAAIYDKIHLFDPHLRAGRNFSELRRFKPGRKSGSFETPFGRVGMAICFDLRFSEYFRRLARSGVSIFAVASAFIRQTGQKQWELLVRARAADSQSFILSANQCGVSPCGTELFGNSMIVDPWGQVLERAGDSQAIVMCQLSIERAGQIRRALPILAPRGR